MVELLPSKQVTRVRFPSPASERHDHDGTQLNGNQFNGVRRTERNNRLAAVAQLVEHLLGKEEVLGSSPSSSLVVRELVVEWVVSSEWWAKADHSLLTTR